MSSRRRFLGVLLGTSAGGAWGAVGGSAGWTMNPSRETICYRSAYGWVVSDGRYACVVDAETEREARTVWGEAREVQEQFVHSHSLEEPVPFWWDDGEGFQFGTRDRVPRGYLDFVAQLEERD